MRGVLYRQVGYGYETLRQDQNQVGQIVASLVATSAYLYLLDPVQVEDLLTATEEASLHPQLSCL